MKWPQVFYNCFDFPCRELIFARNSFLEIWLELDEPVYLNFNKTKKYIAFYQYCSLKLGFIKLIFSLWILFAVNFFLFWIQSKNNVINTDLEVPKDILY